MRATQIVCVCVCVCSQTGAEFTFSRGGDLRPGRRRAVFQSSAPDWDHAVFSRQCVSLGNSFLSCPRPGPLRSGGGNLAGQRCVFPGPKRDLSSQVTGCSELGDRSWCLLAEWCSLFGAGGGLFVGALRVGSSPPLSGDAPSLARSPLGARTKHSVGG